MPGKSPRTMFSTPLRGIRTWTADRN